jgi:rhodanese-related sulfurtransferase
MPATTLITVPEFSRLIGLPNTPAFIDVRVEDDYRADPRLVPGSLRRDHRATGSWAPEYHGKSVVIVCQRGAKAERVYSRLVEARRHRRANARRRLRGLSGGRFRLASAQRRHGSLPGRPTDPRVGLQSYNRRTQALAGTGQVDPVRNRATLDGIRLSSSAQEHGLT